MKKGFKAPATQFISVSAEDTTAQPETTTAKRTLQSIQPKARRETKSARVNFLFLPSVWTDLQKIAEIEGTSCNAIVNDLCKEYIAKWKADNNVE